MRQDDCNEKPPCHPFPSLSFFAFIAYLDYTHRNTCWYFLEVCATSPCLLLATATVVDAVEHCLEALVLMVGHSSLTLLRSPSPLPSRVTRPRLTAVTHLCEERLDHRTAPLRVLSPWLPLIAFAAVCGLVSLLSRVLASPPRAPPRKLRAPLLGLSRRVKRSQATPLHSLSAPSVPPPPLPLPSLR